MRAWLKDLRENRALTQAQVANQLQIKQNYYCEIENGKKQIDFNLSGVENTFRNFVVNKNDKKKQSNKRNTKTKKNTKKSKRRR